MAKAYEVGTRIYYTGDQANIPGNGTITEVIQPGKYNPLCYNILMDDGRTWNSIYHISFNPGIGRRFWLLDEYQANRQKEIEKLQAYLKSRNIVA